jgi:hypothetical protein
VDGRPAVKGQTGIAEVKMMLSEIDPPLGSSHSNMGE